MKKLHKILTATLLSFCILLGGIAATPQEVTAAPILVITDYSAVFDAAYYYNTYPDLQ